MPQELLLLSASSSFLGQSLSDEANESDEISRFETNKSTESKLRRWTEID